MERGWTATIVMAAAIGAGIWVKIGDTRAATGSPVLRLCYENVDVRPWRYRRGGGLNFQLLERAAKRAGVSFEYEVLPRQDCLARVRSNQVDGAVGDGRGFEGEQRLPIDGENASYLILSRQVVARQSAVVERIGQSIEAVRASAAYQVLERHALTLQGKT